MDLIVYSYKSRLRLRIWKVFLVMSLTFYVAESWRITQKCPHGHFFNDGCTACWCDTRTGTTKCEKLLKCVHRIVLDQVKCPQGRHYKDTCGNDCTCFESTGTFFCNEKRKCVQEIISESTAIPFPTATPAPIIIPNFNGNGISKRDGLAASYSPTQRPSRSPHLPMVSSSAFPPVNTAGPVRRSTIFDKISVSSTPHPQVRIPSRSRSEELIIEPAIIIRQKGSNKASVVRNPSSATSVKLSSSRDRNSIANRPPTIILNKGDHLSSYPVQKAAASSAFTPMTLYEKQLKTIMDIRKAYSQLLNSKVNFKFQIATGKPAIHDTSPSYNPPLVDTEGLSNLMSMDHPRRFDSDFDNTTFFINSTPSPPPPNLLYNSPLNNFVWRREQIKNAIKQFSPVPPLKKLVSFVSTSTESYLSQFLNNLGNKNRQQQIQILSPETTTVSPVTPVPSLPTPYYPMSPYSTMEPFHEHQYDSASVQPIHEVYQNHDFKLLTTTTPPPTIDYRPYNTFPQHYSYDEHTTQFPFMNELMEEIVRSDHHHLPIPPSIPTATPRSSPALTAVPTFQTPGPPYAEIDVVQPLSFLPPPEPEPATPTRRTIMMNTASSRQHFLPSLLPRLNRPPRPTVRVNLDKPIYLPNTPQLNSPQQTQQQKPQQQQPFLPHQPQQQPFLPNSPQQQLFLPHQPQQQQTFLPHAPQQQHTFLPHVPQQQPTFRPPSPPQQPTFRPNFPPYQTFLHFPKKQTFLPQPQQNRRNHYVQQQLHNNNRHYMHPTPIPPTRQQYKYHHHHHSLHRYPSFFLPRPKQYRLVLKGRLKEAATRVDDAVPNFVSKIAHEFFKKPDIYVPKIRPGKPLTLEKVVLNHKEIVPKEVMLSQAPGQPMTKLRFTPQAHWTMKEDLAKQGIMLNEPLQTAIRDYSNNDPNVMEMDAPMPAVNTWEKHTGMGMGIFNTGLNYGSSPTHGATQESQSFPEYPHPTAMYLPSSTQYPQYTSSSPPPTPDYQHQQELQHQLLLAQQQLHLQRQQQQQQLHTVTSTPSPTNINSFNLDPNDFNDFGQHASSSDNYDVLPHQLNIPGVKQVVVDKFMVHDPLDPSGNIQVFSTTTVDPPVNVADNVDLASILTNHHRQQQQQQQQQFFQRTGLPMITPTPPPAVLIRHHGAPSPSPPSSVPAAAPSGNFFVTVINTTPTPYLTSTGAQNSVTNPTHASNNGPTVVMTDSATGSTSIVSQIQDFLTDQMDFGARPQFNLYDMLFHSRAGSPGHQNTSTVLSHYKDGDRQETEVGEESQERQDDQMATATNHWMREEDENVDVETDKLANIFSTDYLHKYNRKPPEVIVIKVPPEHSDGPFPKLVEKRLGQEIEIVGGRLGPSKNQSMPYSKEEQSDLAPSPDDSEEALGAEIISSSSKRRRNRKGSKRKRKRKKKNRRKNKNQRTRPPDEDTDEEQFSKSGDNSKHEEDEKYDMVEGASNKSSETNPSKNQEAEQKFQSELDWKSQLMANICDLNPSSPLCLTYRSICLLMTSDD